MSILSTIPTLISSDSDLTSFKGIFSFLFDITNVFNIGAYLPIGCSIALSVCFVLVILRLVKSYVPFC